MAGLLGSGAPAPAAALPALSSWYAQYRMGGSSSSRRARHAACCSAVPTRASWATSFLRQRSPLLADPKTQTKIKTIIAVA